MEDEEPTPQEEVAGLVKTALSSGICVPSLLTSLSRAERLSEVTSKKLAPGQATAIITGGVSIVIGVCLADWASTNVQACHNDHHKQGIFTRCLSLISTHIHQSVMVLTFDMPFVQIGYLVLAYFLDQRGGGGMMQPPPPEAFN